MRPRHADVLRKMGFEGTVEESRGPLATVKAEMFPGLTDEELSFTRDQAGDFVAEVKKRLWAPKLNRVFVLRALIGLRKMLARRPVPGTNLSHYWFIQAPSDSHTIPALPGR